MLRMTIALLYVLYDIFMSRFITEDCAVNFEMGKDGLLHAKEVVPLKCVLPGEEFEGIITVSSFNFFGYAAFAKMIGDVREWK